MATKHPSSKDAMRSFIQRYTSLAAAFAAVKDMLWSLLNEMSSVPFA